MRKIPGLLHAVQYERKGARPGPYEHFSETPTEIIGLKDGSVKLRSKGTRLWGEDAAGEVWLENRPKPKKEERAMARNRNRNPFLAAYNPGAVTALKHYFSADYLKAGAFGVAGVGVTYLGSQMVLSLGPLAQWATAADWTSIAVRGAVRVGVAFGSDAVLSKAFGGHDRAAFIAGGAAYAVGSTILEAMGYQVVVGAGQPLTALIPASFQPAIAGAGSYVQRPMLRAVSGAGSYVPRPVSMEGAGMYRNSMHPMR